MSEYVIGVDYGTLSGRAVVVRVSDGAEVGTAVYEYPNAVIETVLPATGEALPPDWALQDPDDYRGVLREAVPAAIAASGVAPADVIGIGIDFGGGGQYRPPLSENMVITAGASALRLGDGLRDIYDGRHWFVQLFANLRLQF